MKRLFILVLFSLTLLSCAHVISKEYAEVAEKNIPFNELLKNTDGYLNKMFIFRGIIAETKITATGSEIEVVQTPLDRLGKFQNIKLRSYKGAEMKAFSAHVPVSCWIRGNGIFGLK